jgi:hypothetical protein
MWLAALTVSGAVLRTQSVSLDAGWNAVFLEVTPEVAEPDALFEGMPVDIVATYFPTVSGVQFISDPSELPWKKPGWGVWYAPDHAEAAFGTLVEIAGNRAYLVHATRAVQWEISGTVAFQRLVWKPNSFNFVGLPVDASNPPTFAQFFGHSRAHATARFYKLDGGSWRKITSPATEIVRAGVAYWVYCAGRSDYQGPLNVSFSGLDRLDFGAAVDAAEITVRNSGNTPATVQLESGEDMLPLRRIVLDRQTLRAAYDPLPQTLSLGELDEGGAVEVSLQIRRDDMSQAVGSGLLTIRSTAGALLRLPVSAARVE